MLKAAALLYSIIISLVIALLTGSIILAAGLSGKIFSNQIRQNELQLNAASGIQVLMAGKEIVPICSDKAIDLFDEGSDSVCLKRDYWGAFELWKSKAVRKNENFERVALAGFVTDPKEYSLYLADKGTPLSVCGATTIRGNVCLPKSGIRRAFIEGESYSGATFIDGDIKQSLNEIPELNNEMIKSILNLKSQLNEEATALLKHNSFLNDPIIYSSPKPMTLNDTLTGRIVVFSDSEVIITAEAILKDILVFAPKIRIKKAFNGNAQFFANDSIIVEEGVTLNYPSVLGLIKKNGDKDPGCISLSLNDSILGAVFACRQQGADKHGLLNVNIAKDCFVYGDVYSEGSVDIKGGIYGSVMCNSLVLRTSSSVYENHLLNAVIDKRMLPHYFIETGMMKSSNLKSVVRWLD